MKIEKPRKLWTKKELENYKNSKNKIKIMIDDKIPIYESEIVFWDKKDDKETYEMAIKRFKKIGMIKNTINLPCRTHVYIPDEIFFILLKDIDHPCSDCDKRNKSTIIPFIQENNLYLKIKIINIQYNTIVTDFYVKILNIKQFIVALITTPALVLLPKENRLCEKCGIHLYSIYLDNDFTHKLTMLRFLPSSFKKDVLK